MTTKPSNLSFIGASVAVGGAVAAATVAILAWKKNRSAVPNQIGNTLKACERALVELESRVHAA